MFDFLKKLFSGEEKSSNNLNNPKKYIRYFGADGKTTREYPFLMAKLPLDTIGYEVYEKNERGRPINSVRFYYGEEVPITEVYDAWNEIIELESAGFTRGLKIAKDYFILVHEKDFIIEKKVG